MLLSCDHAAATKWSFSWSGIQPVDLDRPWLADPLDANELAGFMRRLS